MKAFKVMIGIFKTDMKTLDFISWKPASDLYYQGKFGK